MRATCVSALLLILSFNSFAEDTQFIKYCKNLDSSNKTITAVRVKTFAVLSMRLSADPYAKSAMMQFIDMSGKVTALSYPLAAPSPTDNITVSYIKQAATNNTLLDVCYDTVSRLVGISNHE